MIVVIVLSLIIGIVIFVVVVVRAVLVSFVVTVIVIAIVIVTNLEVIALNSCYVHACFDALYYESRAVVNTGGVLRVFVDIGCVMSFTCKADTSISTFCCLALLCERALV